MLIIGAWYYGNNTYITKHRLNVDCLQGGFVMYKNKLILLKIEVINPITDSMIPVDYCQKISPIIIFTTDDITSKSKLFLKKTINALCLSESIQTDWLQRLYEYWEEVDTPYSDDYDLGPQWLFQYFNKVPLWEAIEIAYLILK